MTRRYVGDGNAVSGARAFRINIYVLHPSREIARPGRRWGIHSSCSAGLLVYFFRTPRTDNPKQRLSEKILLSSESVYFMQKRVTANMLALVSSVFVQ